MNAFAPLVSLRRRLVCFAVLVAIAAPGIASADGPPEDASTAYEHAVVQYTDAATKELDAYRHVIAAAKTPDEQKKYAEAKARLADCDAKLAKLKQADQAHFDPSKSDYERSRARLAEAFKDAQK